MINRFIEQLGKDVDIPVPTHAGNDGCFHLDFDPNLHIRACEYNGQSIGLQCLIAPLPQEKKEEFFLRCMEANLLGNETGGACLGVDNQEAHVVLSLTLSSCGSYKEFRDAVEDFLNYADAWRQETLVFSELNNETVG